MALSPSTKALLAGVSGTSLQWYDFAIFGYLAPIIATIYFPNDNHFISLLNAWSVFAVGYLLAPLGSVVFGYIGDHYGRRHALMISILAMAIPTSFISILPGYDIIGLAAPILIITLRVIQGFVASAEFTGSAIFFVEHAKPMQKAFYGSLTSFAYSAGLMSASFVASFLTASFMPEWGWRLGFAFALFAGMVIFYCRFYVSESREYEQLREYEKPTHPFITALRENPYAIVGVVGIAWLVGIMTFGTYVYAVSYLNTNFNLSLSTASLIISFALMVDAISEPFIAIIADRVGHLRIIRTGMMAMMLLSVPLFYLLSSGQVFNITVAMILMSLLIAITYAPLNAYMVSLFPKQYRYSGFGVAFNIGISLFGGTTPFVMTWLVQTSGSTITPGYYYVMGSIIGLASLAICENDRRRVVQSNYSMNVS